MLDRLRDNKILVICFIIWTIFSTAITFVTIFSTAYPIIKHKSIELTGIGSDFEINAHSFSENVLRNGESLKFFIQMTNEYLVSDHVMINISLSPPINSNNVFLVCKDYPKKESIFCKNNTFFYNHQLFNSKEPVFYDYELIPKNLSKGKYDLCFEVISVSNPKNNNVGCISFEIKD